MAVVVIDTIKPKNNGTFPVVEAVDVKVTNDKRLDAALNDKANQSDLTALQTTVAGKASQADLTSLSETVSGKASQADLSALSNTVDTKASAADLTALSETVSTKAAASDLATTNATVATKANASDVTTATANLQGQINQIEISATAEAVVAPEVAAARVGDDGTEYSTLKDRLDTENGTNTASIEVLNDSVFENSEKPITWVNELMANGQVLKNNPNDKVSNPIMLYAGETIKVKTKGDGYFIFNVISQVSSMDVTIAQYSTTVTNLVSITGTSLTEYTYTAPVDTPIVVCVLIDSSSQITFENLQKKSKLDTFKEEQETVNESVESEIDNLQGAVYETEEKVITWNAGLMANNTTIKNNQNDKTSNPFMLYAGETIKVKTKGDGFYSFNVISRVPSIYSPIDYMSVVVEPLVILSSTSITEYTYTAASDMPIIVTALDDETTEVTFSNLVVKNRIDVIQGELDSIAAGFDSVYTAVPLDFSQHPAVFFQASVGNAITLQEGWDTSPAVAVLEVNPSEQYRIRGQHYYQCSCYAITDENDICIHTESGSGNFIVFDTITIPEGGKKLYINCYGLRFFQKVGTGIPTKLQGKKICYDGDSICESRVNNNLNTYNGGAYPKLISDVTGCDYVNFAVSGGILRNQEASGTEYHSVVDTLTSLPNDADIYCFEGGINDYWTTAPLGSYSKTDYNTQLDISTVCGAVEYILKYAIEHFVGKSVCFVITHKITTTSYAPNGNGDTFEDYHNAIVGICEKYGIPYYDAWLDSGLNGWNSVQSNAFLTANSTGTGDGTHPNKDGYMKYYVPQLIQLFESL